MLSNDPTITKMGVEAIIDFYRTIAISNLERPGLNAFMTGADSPSLNVVIDTRENAEFSSNTIELMTNLFKDKKVPWGWFITGISAAQDIEQHGFSLLYKSPGMYFDLSGSLPSTEIFVEVKEACDDLQDWIGPLQEGFPSDDNCEGYRKLNAKLLSDGQSKLRHFIAYCGKEAAASGTLFLSNKSVMLHNLATKNKFKHQGFGTALTLHMMSEAKKAGYKYCFLDASDEGFNLYARLGFKVYCVTSVYEIKKTTV